MWARALARVRAGALAMGLPLGLALALGAGLTACLRPPPLPPPKSLVALEPPPPSLKDRNEMIYDAGWPCLTRGQAARARAVLFAEFPRSRRGRWIRALNRALHVQGADCADDDFLVLVLSAIQLESGVRLDPPLAERDLEALFVRRMEQIAGESFIAAGLISLSDFDDALQVKLRKDTARGHVRTEGDLARYMEEELRPWVRNRLQDEYLLPEALASRAERRWVPDPVQTIGPLQVNVAKAFRNARARGDPVASPAAMRRLLLDSRTALQRGLTEGVGLLRKSYRYYRRRLSPADAVYYAGADYNSGEFSSRNAAHQEMLGRLSGRQLTLDGDLLVYSGGMPADSPSNTERAVRKVFPEMPLGQIRRDLLLEKEALFADTAVARSICALYRQRSGEACPVARVPAGAENPRAGLKLGRHYTPANYARGLFARFKKNRAAYRQVRMSR